METLFQIIRQLVEKESYVVGQHASERLEERGMLEWQVVVGLAEGELIAERTDAFPIPPSKSARCFLMVPRSRRSGPIYEPAELPNYSQFTTSTKHEVSDMRLAGQRIKRTRLIQTENYVVAVEVDMVVPADDPSEPCYESETIHFLRDVQEHAEREDLAWLKERGKVYAAVEVASADSD